MSNPVLPNTNTYLDEIHGPMEDRMDIDIIIRGIPKSKAREICENVVGYWDPRYETTIRIVRTES